MSITDTTKKAAFSQLDCSNVAQVFLLSAEATIMLRSGKLLFSFARSLIRQSRRNLTAIKLHTANTDVTEESGPFLHSTSQEEESSPNSVSHRDPDCRVS